MYPQIDWVEKSREGNQSQEGGKHRRWSSSLDRYSKKLGSSQCVEILWGI